MWIKGLRMFKWACVSNPYDTHSVRKERSKTNNMETEKKNLSCFSYTYPLPPFKKIIAWFRCKNNFPIAEFQVYSSVLSAVGYMWMHSVC